MGVEAAHAGDLVAEALFGEDLGDSILGHPGLVTVPQAVRGQAGLDRPPASEWRVIWDGLDAPATGRGEYIAWLGAGPSCQRDAGPGGGVRDDEPGGAAGAWLVASVAGGAEDAAAVVAAPVVAAVRTQEHVPAGAAVLRGARAPLLAAGLELAGEQVVQERREVDREPRLESGAAVGVILRREAVEPAVDLVELPFDVDLAGVGVVALQADRFTPAQPGVADRDDQSEVVVAAGQQRGPLGEQ